MKRVKILLLSATTLIFFTQCSSPENGNLPSDAASRGKIISTLMSNDGYMNEVMDSMRTKHPDIILSTAFVVTKSDKAMQEKMADKMTDMCKMDSSMCKMMMGKTMDMCDADQSKCNMMMNMASSRKNVMKSMQGMCNMNNMKGKPENKK